MLDRIEGHSFLSRRLQVVVDLGAHRGGFSKPLADKYGATVVGLEADRELAAALGCEWGAIAGHDGTVVLRATGFDASTVLEGISEGTTVPAVSLSTLFARHGLERVDLLKLDVEGAELDVIERDIDTLVRCDQITVEFHDFIDPRLANRVASARRRLRGAGFVELRFSRDNTDVLYAHSVSPLEKAWLLLRRKYIAGSVRVLHRRFS